MIFQSEVFLSATVNAETGLITYNARHLRTGLSHEISAPPSVHYPRDFEANRAALLRGLEKRIEYVDGVRAGL